MKSKIVLIMPPGTSDFDSFNLPSWSILRLPPFGLLSLGSYLHEKGHGVKIIDCREQIITHRTNDYLPLALKAIDEFKPDMVGINILTALFEEAVKISKAVKESHPDTLLVAGGVHPSVEPEFTFKQNPYIDAIGIGAGEEICLELLEKGKDRGIAGLMWRDRPEQFIARPPETNIDKYPFPDYNLINKNFYTDFTVNTMNEWGHRCLIALTSRGCPYSCNFCASEWSKPFRFHSPEYVVAMVKQLAREDINVIHFWDDTIGAIKDRLFKICDEFIREKIFWPYTGLRWFCCLRANQVNPETLKKIKEAGCCGIHLGVESGSDRMLQAVNKKTTAEMNAKACAMITEAGLSLTAAFIFGFPGESDDDMKQTLNFMTKIDCNSFGVSNFRPLPGSPFYEQFIQDGRLSRENIDWTNLGNFSIPPKYLFCEAPRQVLDYYIERASDIESTHFWHPVHEDIRSKYPALIREIASQTRVKIARPDHYESSAHKAYVPLTLPSLVNFCRLWLQTTLPFRVRKTIRTVTKLLPGKKT